MTEISNFTLLTIFASNGTLEWYYQGIEQGLPSSGTIYFYQSSNLRNFTGLLVYPQNIQLNKARIDGNPITLFFVGSSLNNIILTYRIKEYHAANCLGENLIFSSNFIQSFQIGANHSGPCIFSIISPSTIWTNYSNFLVFTSLRYENNSVVSVVSGYNSTYTLFGFNKTTAQFYNGVYLFGNFLSLIIPPGSVLNGRYRSDLINPTIRHMYDNGEFVDVIMSPNYPYMVKANENINITYAYHVAYGTITLVILADIPKECLFRITNGKNRTFIDSSRELVNNKTIQFNETYFEIDFIGNMSKQSSARARLTREGSILHPRKISES